MKIPKSIKIGGNIVEIVISSWTSHRMGSVDLAANKIYINSANCKSQQMTTLLHEILEYINNSCDLGLNHPQISVLENMLYQVLIDNKLCFKEESEGGAYC